MRQAHSPVLSGGAARRLLLLSAGTALIASIANACGSGDPFRSEGAEAGAAGAPGPMTSGGDSSTSGSGGRPASTAGSGGSVGAAGAPTEPGGAGAGATSECATGTADCNDAIDGCETKLDREEHCGRCDNVCKGPKAPHCAKVDGEYACVNPVQALSAQRLELPCAGLDPKVPELCESVAQRAMSCPTGGKLIERTLKLGGRPGVIYDVTLRIRGVLEPKVYEGGQAVGDHFYVGGTVKPSNYNTFGLKVSDPEQTYFLNHDSASGEVYVMFPLDHTKVIQVAGGATITLGINDPDCAMVRNCKSFMGECQPYVVEGIPPAPDGFDGQFVQLDVVSVSVAP